jgi:hypothetical protein
MHEAVDGGERHGWLDEHFAPLRERRVGRDGQALVLVTLGDQLEQDGRFGLVAHGDGSFARRLTQLAKLDLLVIDDFAISPIGPAERSDLLELLDDRVGTHSTIITSQLPVKAWHTYLNDPTLADAILDRIVHSSHRIDLKGKSLRDDETMKSDPLGQA